MSVGKFENTGQAIIADLSGAQSKFTITRRSCIIIANNVVSYTSAGRFKFDIKYYNELVSIKEPSKLFQARMCTPQ